jgi:hypothetical protein
MDRNVGLAPPAPEHDESFEELAAAAALGSIEPDDAARFRPHLAACARCRELLSDYGAVVDLLPLSLPEAAEAPALKVRLLAAAGSADAGTRRHGDTETVLTPLPRVPASPRPRVPYLLPLAAMLLISLGLGWWNLSLQEQLRAQQARIERQEQFIAAVAAGGQRVALAGTNAAPGASGEVVQPPGGGPPLLTVQGLPALPADREYQVWVISGGQPTGAGLLRPDADGPPVVPLERDLAGAQTVALTIEPLGGSPGPTGPIVLAGNL